MSNFVVYEDPHHADLKLRGEIFRDSVKVGDLLLKQKNKFSESRMGLVFEITPDKCMIVLQDQTIYSMHWIDMEFNGWQKLV